MQGKFNNFDIDLLQIIVQAVSKLTGVAYHEGVNDGAAGEHNALIRRIADHVRAVTFAIADNALPSNKGAGYIIRRLIRRATLDADKLGLSDTALYQLVPAVVEAMGDAYPEIKRRQDVASDALKAEEAQFRRTLRRGLDLLTKALHNIPDGDTVFPGDQAFRLYETFGFPREITEEIIAERGLQIDDAAWQLAETHHKTVSASFKIDVFTSSALQEAAASRCHAVHWL